MTDDTSLNGSPPSDAATRLAGLKQAVEAGRGRVDREALESAAALVERGEGRLARSGEHTIVALAGATGSGKSSLFNALTDLEIAGVGVRRPTTSWTLACAWGPAGGDEILEWIGIPPRHRVSRMSMLDRSSEDTKLDGMILLDLPDHDSTEVGHHLEMERLVQYADVVVWVLDPQKYADAVIHERYIRPMAQHAATTIVVLNQIDRISYEQRKMALEDVERIVAEGGLPDVPVLGVSATRGDNIDELKRELARRIRAKESARDRLTSEIAAAARIVAEASGTAKIPGATDEAVTALESGLVEAAGVPSLVETVRIASTRRASRRTTWPPFRLLGRLGSDPVSALAAQAELDVADVIEATSPTTSTVQRSRAEAAIRDFADTAASSAGKSWNLAIRDASTVRSPEVVERIDEALVKTDIDLRQPTWWSVIEIVQWILFVAGIAGIVWWALDLADIGLPQATTLGGQSVMLPLGLGLLVAGLVLMLIARILIRSSAHKRAEEARTLLSESVRRVAHDQVVTPVRAELDRYNRCREGLAAALRT